MKSSEFWLHCISNDMRIYGILIIDFEDARKARNALGELVKAMGDALNAEECEITKYEGD